VSGSSPPADFARFVTSQLFSTTLLYTKRITLRSLPNGGQATTEEETKRRPEAENRQEGQMIIFFDLMLIEPGWYINRKTDASQN
jgi:hypothetical protein